MAATTFREVAQRFLASRRPYLKPKSLESYEVCVRRLCLAGLGRAAARRIGPRQIEHYIEHERARGMKDGAINVRLRALRAILRWAAEPEIGLLDRAPRVRLLRVPTGLGGQALGSREIAQLLAAAEGASWTAVRDRALVLVLVGGGLRIDEALHLRWSDLVGERLTISAKADWTPKNHQERAVFLPSPALAALEELRKSDRRRLGVPELHEGWIFRSQRGKRLKHAAARGRRLFREAGVHERGRCWHELRRGAATSWHRNGAPLDAIRRALGHQSLATTQRYLLLDEDALRDLTRKGLV